MASKKVVNKKDETKKAIMRKKLVSELVEKFDLVENKEKSFTEDISKNFRVASIAIYDALNTKSVFKSIRHLATEMKRSKSDVHRYAQAGKFLKNVTDEQLKKVGMNAYSVKTQLRKVQSAIAPKNATELKKVSTKKVSKKVSVITIDDALKTIETFIKNSPEPQKVLVIKNKLQELIMIQNKKERAFAEALKLAPVKISK